MAVEAKSDVDRYFDSPRIGVDAEAMDDPNGLFQWWRVNIRDYPQMAATARLGETSWE
ncbi:hypothetical protein V1508DRAFT_427251 [Lipomyces doorenjongii]|uniref:uncharacterized protein n=1 Tax=Lipomyces doorenjongii TaxID=383834 RepID=UPI0034CF2A4A